MEEFEPKKKTKIISKEFIMKYAYVFVLAILLIGGVSYSYTFFTENRKIASGSITTANLTINFTDRSINATNLSIPANDKEGLVEFTKSVTITNQTSIDGRVKLTLTRTSGLELTDLRYALVINGAIQEINDVPTSGLILSSAIMGNEVINVEVRLWPKITYSGSVTTFVGELTPEIKYLGSKATTSIANPAGKYVNFNCSSTCEVWQIVKVEDDRLVLTRQSDYSGATSRTNSNKYDSSLTFNDNSLITSVSTDGKNVYLARTVKIDGGSGTQVDPYKLISNDFREGDKKVIAVITYKDDNANTVGIQNIYYNETNYISQVIDDPGFKGWTDGTNDYELGDVVNFTSDTILTAKIVYTLKNKIMSLCNDSSVAYVKPYTSDLGTTMDTYDGRGHENVCYYTSTTSANLAGANGNVLFGDFCWQIVRTTDTGGIKLIYNGPPTVDGKCTSDQESDYSSNPRLSAIGVRSSLVQKKTISGNKIYGDSFEIYDDNGTNKFRLKNTSSASWSDATYQSLIGKYVCGTSGNPTGTSDTCESLYYVGHYVSNTEAFTANYYITNVNAHYSQIGISLFNPFGSPALVGYMYGDVYSFESKYFPVTFSPVITSTSMLFSSYYYGDAVTWVNDHYELTIGGVTPTITSSWEDIRSNAEGMYTCLSSNSSSCASVHYIVANSANSYMYSILLSNNETKDKTVTWHYGTSIAKVGDTYTLMDGNNTSTLTKTFKLADWYTTYNTDNGYKNIYVCDDFTSTSCTTVRLISYTSKSDEGHYTLNYTYKFANDIIYDATTHEYKYDLNKSVQDIYDWPNQYNTIDNTHYTCFDNYDEVNNTCGANNPIYYVYYTGNIRDISSDGFANYIELTNNEKVEDALKKMLNYKQNSNEADVNINRYNSSIKGIVDNFYETKLSAVAKSFLDSSIMFCNDREIKTNGLGGWNANGGSTTSNHYIQFAQANGSNENLSCANVTDRFSIENTKAELSYPIGLLSIPEINLMRSYYAKTGKAYWSLSPSVFKKYESYIGIASNSGSSFAYSSQKTDESIRPVVSLKSSVEITGSGTYDDPYVVTGSNIQNYN